MHNFKLISSSAGTLVPFYVIITIQRGDVSALYTFTSLEFHDSSTNVAVYFGTDENNGIIFIKFTMIKLKNLRFRVRKVPQILRAMNPNPGLELVFFLLLSYQIDLRFKNDLVSSIIAETYDVDIRI